MNITFNELLTSFTKSIDLYNYLLKNHHLEGYQKMAQEHEQIIKTSVK